MNKALIGLVVAVVVIGGGYYYWQNAKTNGFDASKPYAISGEVGGTASSTAASNTKEMSLKDLLVSTKAQKCTLKVGTLGAGVDGVVYVSSGKIRGDFSSDSAVGKVGTHMIVRDGSTYSWVDGFKAGLKAPVVAGTASKSGGVDVNAKFNYDCGTWSVDNSVFTLPKEITFSAN
jgi:hypothetical protein